MLDFVTALWLGFIGACLGSFINVVAYRMPRGMSVVWKPSHCPACGHAIRARDNVPVLGWIILRGRCRDCGASISPRYAIVEAAMGAAFFTLAYVELFSGGANLPGRPLTDATGAWHTVWDPNWSIIRVYAYHSMLLCLLMAMALMDQDRQRIPASLVVFGLVIVAAASYQWWDLYPERTRTVRVKELKAPLDALCGVVWGACPAAVAAVVASRRMHGAAASTLVRIAMGLGVAGGFLGLRAIVRVALLWAPVALARRVIRPRGAALGNLAWLWLATFLQIVFWKPLAAYFSW